MGRLYRRLGTALVVGAILTATSCGADPKPKPTPLAESTTAAPSATWTPPPPPPKTWPLTGVVVATPVDRPALAVKIENSIDARPQTGLNAADMVWEQVVEGGITRFLAVYHSSIPRVIGPVRSVRPMDPPIAAPLRGLFAFSGGQPPFPANAAASGLQVLSMDAGSAGFYRGGGRPAPHNVYADPSTFLRQANATHRHAPPQQFAFAAAGELPAAVAAGIPVSRLALTLSGLGHPQWSWSSADHAWLRSEGGTPSVEASGSRMRATNVVVLRVDIVNTSYRDPANNPVPETKLVGSGKAIVASGGKALAVTWSKASIGAPVILTGAYGTPVRLAPGTTWVELVPNGSGAVSFG